MDLNALIRNYAAVAEARKAAVSRKKMEALARALASTSQQGQAPVIPGVNQAARVSLNASGNFISQEPRSVPGQRMAPVVPGQWNAPTYAESDRDRVRPPSDSSRGSWEMELQPQAVRGSSGSALVPDQWAAPRIENQFEAKGPGDLIRELINKGQSPGQSIIKGDPIDAKGFFTEGFQQFPDTVARIAGDNVHKSTKGEDFNPYIAAGEVASLSVWPFRTLGAGLKFGQGIFRGEGLKGGVKGATQAFQTTAPLSQAAWKAPSVVRSRARFGKGFQNLGTTLYDYLGQNQTRRVAMQGAANAARFLGRETPLARSAEDLQDVNPLQPGFLPAHASSRVSPEIENPWGFGGAPELPPPPTPSQAPFPSPEFDLRDLTIGTGLGDGIPPSIFPPVRMAANDATGQPTWPIEPSLRTDPRAPLKAYGDKHDYNLSPPVAKTGPSNRLNPMDKQQSAVSPLLPPARSVAVRNILGEPITGQVNKRVPLLETRPILPGRTHNPQGELLPGGPLQPATMDDFARDVLRNYGSETAPSRRVGQGVFGTPLGNYAPFRNWGTERIFTPPPGQVHPPPTPHDPLPQGESLFGSDHPWGGPEFGTGGIPPAASASPILQPSAAPRGGIERALSDLPDYEMPKGSSPLGFGPSGAKVYPVPPKVGALGRVKARLKEPAGPGKPIPGMGVFNPDRRGAHHQRRMFLTRRKAESGDAQTLMEAGQGRHNISSRFGGRASQLWTRLSRPERMALEVMSKRESIDQRIKTIRADIADAARAKDDPRRIRLLGDIDDFESARPFISINARGYTELSGNASDALRAAQDHLSATARKTERRRGEAKITLSAAAKERLIKEKAQLTQTTMEEVSEKIKNGTMTLEELGDFIPRSATRLVMDQRYRASATRRNGVGEYVDQHYEGYNQRHGLIDYAEGIEAAANHVQSTSHIIATKETVQSVGRAFGSPTRKSPDDIALHVDDLTDEQFRILESGEGPNSLRGSPAGRQESAHNSSNLGGTQVRERADNVSDVIAGSYAHPQLRMIPDMVESGTGKNIDVLPGGTGTFSDATQQVTVGGKQKPLGDVAVDGIVYVDPKVLGKALDGKRNIPTMDRELDFFLKTIGKGVIDELNGAVRLSVLYLNPAYISMNLLGNESLGLVHQGFAHPERLAQAVFASRNMQRSTVVQIDNYAGSGIAFAGQSSGHGGLMQSVTGEIAKVGGLNPQSAAGQRGLRAVEKLSFARLANALATQEGKLIDVIPRRAAWMHEAMIFLRESGKSSGGRTIRNTAQRNIPGGKTRRVDDGSILGSKQARERELRATMEDIEDFVKHGSKEDLDMVSTRAQRAMVDFESLSQVERQVISRVIFFYPWLKGSTRLTRDLIQDHPVAALSTAYVGNEWRTMSNEHLGDRPNYMQPRNVGLPGIQSPTNFLPQGFKDSLGIPDLSSPELLEGETFIPELNEFVPTSRLPIQAIPSAQTVDLAVDGYNALFKGGDDYNVFDFTREHLAPAPVAGLEAITGRSNFNDREIEDEIQYRPWSQDFMIPESGGLGRVVERSLVDPLLKSRTSTFLYRTLPESLGGEPPRAREQRLLNSRTPTSRGQDKWGWLMGEPFSSRGVNNTLTNQKQRDAREELMPAEERKKVVLDRRSEEWENIIRDAGVPGIFQEDGSLHPQIKRILDDHTAYEVAVADWESSNNFDIKIADRVKIAIKIARGRQNLSTEHSNLLDELDAWLRDPSLEVQEKQLAYIRGKILGGDKRVLMGKMAREQENGKDFSWGASVPLKPEESPINPALTGDAG